MTKIEIIELLDQVMHPAINYSLIKLGMLTDIEVNEDKVMATFVFPFPNIPIAEQLIQSVMFPVNEFEMELDFTVRIMTETEKERFLKLETEAWKGL